MPIDLNTVLHFSIVAVLFFTASLLISTIITKQLITWLPKMGLVDQPGGRHIHTHATPKGGGIGFIVATLFCTTIVSIIFCPESGELTFPLCPSSTLKVSLAIIAISFIGFLDDRYNISAKLKLLGQIAVASYCWTIGYQFNSIFGMQLPTFLSYCVTVFWIISFINAFNLIDGLDGLAAGLSIISAGTLAIFFIIHGNMPAALFLIVLMGGLIGFLIYNFHPAKLFMGDTGSMVLGLIFAVSGLVSADKTATLTSLLIPVLAAGVPFFDVILAIWRRLAKRWLLKFQGISGDSKVMGADKEHLHHRIMNHAAGSQRKTVTIIYALAVAFAVLSLLLVFIQSKSQGVTYLLIFAVVIALVRATAYVEFHNSTMAIFHGLRKPSRGMLIQMLHPVYDIAVLLGSYTFIHKLFHEALGGLQFEELKWYQAILTHALAPIGLMLIYKTYKILWQRASGYEYMLLVRSLILGFFSATFFSVIYGLREPNLFLIKEFCFSSMSLLLILGQRMMLRYLKTLMYHSSIRTAGHLDQTEKILIYGAGRHFRYFIDTLLLTQMHDQCHISAVIDDNAFMQGMHVSGFRVDGTVHDIAAIHQEKPFSKIVVTAELNKTHLDLLNETAKSLNIPVVKWQVAETEIEL